MTTTPAQALTLATDAYALIGLFRAQLGTGAIGSPSQRTALAAYEASCDAYVSAGGDTAIIAGLTRLALGFDEIDALIADSDEAPATLAALTLSASTFTSTDSAGTVIGAIQNKTSGSTLSINPADSHVAISSGNLVVGSTPSSAGSFSITIRETLAGATNTPRDTTLSITVNAPGAAGGALDGSDADQSALTATFL